MGLDLYEMDVRSYDPAIARWTGIDPVTHHSLSTYNAFDNNPVIYADPSGADSRGYYELGAGASLNADGSVSGSSSDNSNGRSNKPAAFHSFVANKNKKGVELETGTDIVKEVSRISFSEVKEDGTKIYTTQSTSITTMIDENGIILEDQIVVDVWITTTTVSGDNSNDRVSNTLRLNDNDFGFQNLTPKLKNEIEKIANFKYNFGYSNLRDIKDNRNRGINVILGTIATFSTGGLSSGAQLASGIGVSYGSSYFDLFDTSNIYIKLY
ncbi:MAG: hypothetical protein COB73_09510 [Flavobacteriaceae bacterium]|nr:MAG: hypothetical protein COB73_09510 [Flavobacteriaceae bacterium]